VTDGGRLLFWFSDSLRTSSSRNPACPLRIFARHLVRSRTSPHGSIPETPAASPTAAATHREEVASEPLHGSHSTSKARMDCIAARAASGSEGDEARHRRPISFRELPPEPAVSASSQRVELPSGSDTHRGPSSPQRPPGCAGDLEALGPRAVEDGARWLLSLLFGFMPRS